MFIVLANIVSISARMYSFLPSLFYKWVKFKYIVANIHSMAMRKNTVIPLYVNSVDRTNINDPTTDYVISLRKPLRNIVSISVANLVIPLTYNDINPNNNFISAYVFVELVSGSSVIYTPLEATVANGNYTPAQLATAFQLAMNTSLTSISFGLVWTVAYDPVAFRMVISVVNPTGATLYQWGIEFNYTQCIDIIGIGNGGTSPKTYTAAPSATTLAIPCGRTPAPGEPYSFNITSNLLTDGIDTSYVSSLTKIFNVTTANQRLDFAVGLPNTSPYGNPIIYPSTTSSHMLFGAHVSLSYDGNIAISKSLSYNLASSFTFTRVDPTVDIWASLTEPTLAPPFASPSRIKEGCNVVSGDGSTMILGCVYSPVGRGSVIVYTRIGFTWNQVQVLSDPLSGAAQGTGGSMSANGDIISFNNFDNNIVFRRVGGVWTQDGLPFYPSGTVIIRHQAMSGDGNLILIGTATSVDAWLYSGLWTMTSSLPASYPSVSISSPPSLVVGAYFIAYSDNFAQINTSVGDGITWTPVGTIPNPTATNWLGIGLSLSQNGTTLAATNPLLSELYIYEYLGGSWVLVATFSGVNGTEPLFPPTAQNFSSCALSQAGDVLIAGSPYDANTIVGVSYIYKKTPSGWILAKTAEGNVGAISAFGSSLAISGNIAAIGASADATGGSVFFYNYANKWEPYSTKITRPGTDSDVFGYAVAIDGDNLVVGNPGTFLQPGQAYLYKVRAGGWSYIIDFPNTTTFSQKYGSSLAINGNNRVLIGAPAGALGEVWVWTLNGVWSHQILQLTPLTTPNDRFGKVVQFGISNFIVLANTYVCVYDTPPIGTPVGAPVAINFSISHPGWTLSSADISSNIVIGSAGNGAVILSNIGGIWTELPYLLTYPSILPGNNAGCSVAISDDGNTVVVGDNAYSTTGGTYVWKNAGGVWAVFGDISASAGGAGYSQPSQGTHVAISNGQYLTSGDTANNGSGIVWSFSTTTTATQLFSLNILEPTEALRSFTVFGLIPIFTYDLDSNLSMVATFVNDRYVRLTLFSSLGATFVVADTSTFKSFKWPSTVPAQFQQSNEVDFSINNNIVKSSINTASTTFSGFFTDAAPNENYRIYPAGYTIQNGIDIQLRDERDRIIDLNGANWTCVLLVTIAN
jgi:hypothetical protein